MRRPSSVKIDSKTSAFVREETITPTDQVFDVDDGEIKNIWKGLDSYHEEEKAWEVRIPPLPDMMFGAGVAKNIGERIRQLKVKKVLLTTDPVMFSIGKGRRGSQDSGGKWSIDGYLLQRWNPILPLN